MQGPDSYDFIITGAGCAGLSLAMRMAGSGVLREKKILLLDREAKETNDRTWCFWEKEAGFFDQIVAHSWDKAWFHARGMSKLLDLMPYRYKMIRGLDFYRHCQQELQRQGHVDIRREDVTAITEENGQVYVSTRAGRYQAPYVFNSIRFDESGGRPGDFHFLQHFKGWVVETEEPVFRPAEATLMDFRPTQDQGVTFVYVMPFSEKKALIEYTLFSKSLLQNEDYDRGLRKYLSDFLNLSGYRVVEEEFGVIPMTNQFFPERTGNVLHIGTAGGQTKPSSGYTFRFIQKKTQAIVDSLVHYGHPFQTLTDSGRFHWYDSVLLHILDKGAPAGDDVFRQLFQKNRADRILKFLDNETSLLEETRILSSLPFFPFLKAGWNEALKFSRS